jgi:FkbM family methyltransferase
MSLLHHIRMGLRGWGIELNRYTPAQSSDARLCRLLARLGVDCVADVGANDGGFARGLRAAGYSGDIVSFEPLQEAHSRLTRAAAGDARWHVMSRMALGDSDGIVQVNIAGNSTSSSILPMRAAHRDAAPASQYVGAENVDLRRLDALSHPALDRARAVHLKVDTQGFEMPVLLGATGLLPRVCSMQLELSLVSLYEGQALYRSVIDWVAEKGFELCGVVPGFVDERSGRMLQMDGLFARPQVT